MQRTSSVNPQESVCNDPILFARNNRAVHIDTLRASTPSNEIPKAFVSCRHKAAIACKRFDITREQPVTTNKVELESFSLAYRLCSSLLPSGGRTGGGLAPSRDNASRETSS
ncbi:uncharacterized protein LOC143148545 [Ptiloglossa arizonensis]|uniref:uncharacterized protein LOC143148545 n=1 Tax=Ptiloglossa arizonensis TaxID=3350558 RepID=UPI003FA18DAA